MPKGIPNSQTIANCDKCGAFTTIKAKNLCQPCYSRERNKANADKYKAVQGGAGAPCDGCGLPVERPYKNSEKRLCKACHRRAYYKANYAHEVAVTAKWKEANPEKVLLYRRTYYAKNPEKMQAKRDKTDPEYIKDYRLKTTYGIAIRAHMLAYPEVFQEVNLDSKYPYFTWFTIMLQRQGGKCASKACPHSHGSGGKLPLCVDHSHLTGKIRGLLCNRCNIIAGRMGDDPDQLRSLADFLETHPA